jgi:hypothetical protein
MDVLQLSECLTGRQQLNYIQDVGYLNWTDKCTRCTTRTRAHTGPVVMVASKPSVMFEPPSPSPEPPKHAAPTGNSIGGGAKQEPDALLDRVTHGSHRRRVPHVRTRLRERIRVQARMLEVPLVDGRLARATGR